MTCRDFQNRVSAYLEGDQNEAVRRLMESHAGSCPGCAEALHGVRGLRAGLGRLPRARLSPDFTFALRGKLLMESRKSGLGLRIRSWLVPAMPRTALAGALTLAVAAALFLAVGSPRRPSPSQAPKLADAAGEIPSHYVLERIPAAPRAGVAINSGAYRNRRDSLAAADGARRSAVQVVRF